MLAARGQDHKRSNGDIVVTTARQNPRNISHIKICYRAYTQLTLWIEKFLRPKCQHSDCFTAFSENRQILALNLNLHSRK